jgi:hypothetical protein
MEPSIGARWVCGSVKSLLFSLLSDHKSDRNDRVFRARAQPARSADSAIGTKLTGSRSDTRRLPEGSAVVTFLG